MSRADWYGFTTRAEEITAEQLIEIKLNEATSQAEMLIEIKELMKDPKVKRYILLVEKIK